jgi:hypothetical protein
VDDYDIAGLWVHSGSRRGEDTLDRSSLCTGLVRYRNEGLVVHGSNDEDLALDYVEVIASRALGTGYAFAATR